MDENHARQSFDVHKTFIHPDYDQNRNMDIAFILLEKPVDILKFKPLKLNLTRNNDSLKGQQVDVFGCSPYFGKADCHIVFCDHDDYTLRRGMTTSFSEASDDASRMQSHFYDHRGFVKILKRPSENDPRRIKIKEDIETLQKHRNSVDDHSDEKLDLILRINGLRSELIKMSAYKTLTPIPYTDHFQADLEQLSGTETLNKAEIMTHWEKLLKEEKSSGVDFELGDYHIFMHKPLPRLSAQVFHGDSGGAWVQDNEIVALTASKTCKGPGELFTLNRKADAMMNPKGYFAQCEKELAAFKTLGMADPLIDEKIGVSHAISIWSHREWIEKTLKEIVDQKL